MSVDALRGFDMFWIAGGGMMFRALERWQANPVLGAIKEQLTHVEWAGFHFYDLIFPLFVFLVGVSIVLAIPKSIEKRGRAGTVRHILTRGLLMYGIGVVYSDGWASGWDQVRWLGVLNRIALCYTATALIFTFVRRSWLLPIAIAGLVGYWSMMSFMPIRDIRLEQKSLEALMEKRGETNVVNLFKSTQETVRGKFDPGYNLANHLDFQLLPGKRYDTYYDPEGMLSTLPAIVTCLLGVLAGLWQSSNKVSPTRRSIGLIMAGMGCLLLGYLWSLHFPIVKKLWSSSFVLVAGGYSMILLGVFHQIVDVWQWRSWCQPFVWIGANALTIYLAAKFLNFGAIAQRIAGGPIKTALGSSGEACVSLLGVALLFWFARFLYRRQVFIRL